MGQTNQTIRMIMPSKYKIYKGRKGIGFKNRSYFRKAKDLRPTLYDERVINLLYTSMFLTCSDEALEIEKFKRARENKIEFAYDYGNLNTSYQTSSLKPYVPTMILEKIIIDLEDEVVSLLEKEKENLEIIESLKSKGVESSEKVVSETEKKSENNCQVIEKVCDSEENPNVIAPGMFKSSVSQSVSPISMTKTSCASNGVENKICLWIIDSGCLKHMTGNRALLTNFVEKFLRTVRFGNNDFAVIAGYGDVVIGSLTINKVYYVEGLVHNLFSVEQFCDKVLEVAFRKSTCFVRNEDGENLLTGDRSSNLYTISLNEVASNSSTCLLAKTSSSQFWLWHQRLSHLNFAIINNLVKNDLIQGLPKMKFEKDHLCFACEQGKIHQKHHKSKTAFASNQPLYLFHMDLCGSMHVESINEKRYVIYKKRTRKIHESVNVNFDEILEMASKQFCLEPGLSNLNETGKSSNPSVSQLSKTSKRDLEDLFHNFFDEYFDSSKIMKSSTMNVEISNVKIPSHEEKVFHESSESFQEESSLSCLNDDV
uniref:Integrase, catalytic region, zinc finger, CCHC-type, peptidase aspartic, catalytic n=1 Tax=Tanacetum cinerariifolium TaxID=118510 RepID=A0A6L2MTY0_TANCI|nr:integrase, catalytic region, zinc finger, CCHC-type, peptidase aspartic, catalytic [Tanacetum cinerariifolium]